MTDFITTPGGILIPAPKPEPEPAPDPQPEAEPEYYRFRERKGYGLDPIAHADLIERLGAKPESQPAPALDRLAAANSRKNRGGAHPFDPDCLFIPPICPTCKTPAVGHFGMETTTMGGTQCGEKGCTGYRDVNRIGAVWACANGHTFSARTGYFCDACGKASHWAEEATKGIEFEVRRPENFIPFLNPLAGWRVSKFFRDNKICGCGSPDDFIDWLTKLLRAITDSFDYDNPHPANRDEYENQPKRLLTKAANHDGLHWLAWYWLDATGLTEHGGNVSSGWLSDMGEEMLAALELLGVAGAQEAIK